MRESWSRSSIKGMDLEEESSAKDAGKKLVRQEETQVRVPEGRCRETQLCQVLLIASRVRPGC